MSNISHILTLKKVNDVVAPTNLTTPTRFLVDILLHLWGFVTVLDDELVTFLFDKN